MDLVDFASCGIPNSMLPWWPFWTAYSNLRKLWNWETLVSVYHTVWREAALKTQQQEIPFLSSKASF